MDDDHIIGRAKMGDKTAFASLVEEHGKLVSALARYYVGASDCQDVEQEIWLAVYRKLWQLEDSGKLVPWLKKLVFYHCLNYRKVRSRSREVQLSHGDWRILAEVVADDGSSLEEGLLDREVSEDLLVIVDAPLRQLPPPRS